MPGLGLGLGLHRGQRPSFRGLLNDFGGAAAAYSLRALDSSFLTQDVVLVRRDFDNSEQGFTPAEVTNGALTAFCGAGNGFVKTWYDQSGNGRDATQTTAAAQPQIVASGSLVSDGGLPTLDWGIAQARGLSLSSAISVKYGNFVYHANALNTANHAFGGSVPVILQGSFVGINGLSVLDGTIQSLGNAEGTNRHLGVYYNNGTNNFLAIDGDAATNVGTYTSDVNFSLIGNQTLSYLSVTGSLSGYLSEAIFYASNQSASRTAIESNINGYYNIY